MTTLVASSPLSVGLLSYSTKSLAKRLEPLGLDGGIMDEHIRPTILGSNEPVAATYIEEFNRSPWHTLVSSFVKDSVKANDS